MFYGDAEADFQFFIPKDPSFTQFPNCTLPFREPPPTLPKPLRDVCLPRARPAVKDRRPPARGETSDSPPSTPPAQPTEDELATWRCILDHAAKPLVTDRHLLREPFSIFRSPLRTRPIKRRPMTRFLAHATRKRTSLIAKRLNAPESAS